MNTLLEETLSNQLSKHQNVLIAPLNWGLGHAVRCIPIIYACIHLGKNVFIASDGRPLAFLKSEFPNIPSFELSSYNIKYPFESIVANLFIQSFHILKTIRKENKEISDIIKHTQCTAIISDNRMGVFHKNVLNIYVTHQYNLLHSSKIMACMGCKIHHYFMKNFDTVWIPDYATPLSLAPQLTATNDKRVHYIGPLTTLKKKDCTKDIDILVILSGPEPQRTLLENLLLDTLTQEKGCKIYFIRGTTHPLERKKIENNIKIVNIALRQEIEEVLNRSKLLISRSGYTTVMDTADHDISKIWIPTPGQTEQLYLAQNLSKKPNNIFLEQKNINKLPNILRSLNN